MVPFERLHTLPWHFGWPWECPARRVLPTGRWTAGFGQTSHGIYNKSGPRHNCKRRTKDSVMDRLWQQTALKVSYTLHTSIGWVEVQYRLQSYILPSVAVMSSVLRLISCLSFSLSCTEKTCGFLDLSNSRDEKKKQLTRMLNSCFGGKKYQQHDCSWQIFEFNKAGWVTVKCIYEWTIKGSFHVSSSNTSHLTTSDLTKNSIGKICF